MVTTRSCIKNWRAGKTKFDTPVFWLIDAHRGQTQGARASVYSIYSAVLDRDRRAFSRRQ